jgi:hypothetical protein
MALRKAALVEEGLAPPAVLASPGIELKPLQKSARLRSGDSGETLSSERYAVDDPHLIVVPSPTELRFDGIEIPSRAALIVWISRRRDGPESLPAKPDAAIELSISLVREGAAPVELMRRSVSGPEPGWNAPARERVDLAPFAGQRVSLVFTARGAAYRVCWGAARIQPYH